MGGVGKILSWRFVPLRDDEEMRVLPGVASYLEYAPVGRLSRRMREKENPMSTGETIAKLRQERGMTQAELAKKLFVTRQAVSRWENGDTTPGIDMLKLLAVALDAPVAQLVEMPDTPVCQCCGMYLSTEDAAERARHDAAGLSDDYCVWCYHDGKLHYDDMDEVIEQSAPYLAQSTGLSLDEAVSLMGAVLPELDRWKK